jgi:hypothetical protein
MVLIFFFFAFSVQHCLLSFLSCGWTVKGIKLIIPSGCCRILLGYKSFSYIKNITSATCAPILIYIYIYIYISPYIGYQRNLFFSLFFLFRAAPSLGYQMTLIPTNVRLLTNFFFLSSIPRAPPEAISFLFVSFFYQFSSTFLYRISPLNSPQNNPLGNQLHPFDTL